MDKPIFAKRLVEQRSLKGHTQQQVADLTQLSRARLNNYEQGIREPDIGTTIKLADFYGCTTDYLLGKTDHPFIMTINSVREQNGHYKENNDNSSKSNTTQLSPDELALIEKYRKMKDDEKDTLHKVANHIAPDEQAAAAGK